MRAKVVVIGAGSAGLFALGQVRQATNDFYLIDPGPLGTTCARVGCMPSKVLVQIGDDFHRRQALSREGIEGGGSLRADLSAALAHVRELRDEFVSRVVPRVEALGDKFIQGEARFVAKNVIDAGGQRIEAERFVLAVGSRPVVPGEWLRFERRVLTTDSLFEQTSLPRRIGVIGLGVIGLELGQALARLGIEVTGVDRLHAIGGVSDPVVCEAMTEAVSQEFPIWLGAAADIEETGSGAIRVRAGDRETVVDALLVSLGRRSNLDRLDLAAAGVALDDRGMPAIDPETMQIAGHSGLFVAGDAAGERPVLHEAADEGRIAGVNAVSDSPRRFRRKPRLAITFTDPNVAAIGEEWGALSGRPDVIVGTRKFDTQSRAMVMGRNRGVLRIYGRKSDGLLLGAAIAAPHGEHLAHLLQWSVQDGKTVFDLLRYAFYHPVIEEGLQNALSDLARQVETQPPKPFELEQVPSA